MTPPITKKQAKGPQKESKPKKKEDRFTGTVHESTPPATMEHLSCKEAEEALRRNGLQRR